MDHTTLQREVSLLYNFILIISSCVPTYKELTIIPQTVIVTTAAFRGFLFFYVQVEIHDEHK